MQTWNARHAGIVALLFLSSIYLGAQNNQPVTDSIKRLYRTTPVWKDMIADTNANYFEVQKAFELFWERKELPEEEDEIIGEKRKLKNNLINRTFNARELQAQQLREALAFDYKRYRWWLIRMEPFVKEDGSIMTPTEQLQLWKRNMEERSEK